MTFWALFLIAVGVSMDAFAVALTKGVHMRRFNLRHALIIAVTLWVFQAVMPLIGWLLGSQFARYVTEFDHWIAFGLLLLIGLKMLREAFSAHEDTEQDFDRLKLRELVVGSYRTAAAARTRGWGRSRNRGRARGQSR